jgi:hypothetical protein
MSAMLDKIPHMGGAGLLNLFSNANRLLSKGPHIEAERVITAIQREWKGQFDSGFITYSNDRPEKGMLATLGYRVGSNGEKTSIRHRILRYIVEGELPVVASIGYTREWGIPNSSQRRHKLIRVLESQLTNPGNTGRVNMEKAMIEWNEDMVWIENTFMLNHDSAA